MQSLIQQFHFTSNEDTCWFLGGCNQGNYYKLSQEDWDQLWRCFQAAIAYSDNPFKDLEANLNKLKSADLSMVP